MQLDKKNVTIITVLVFAAIFFAWLLRNLTAFGIFVDTVMGILAPFLLGGAIAFIFNIPMRAIERRLWPRSPRLPRLRRPLAYVITLLLLILLLTVVVSVVIPQLVIALTTASQQAYQAVYNHSEQLNWLFDLYPQLRELTDELHLNMAELSEKFASLLRNAGDLLRSSFQLAGSVISGIATFFVGFVFSIYLLLRKETLAHQGRQVLFALLPPMRAEKTLSVLHLSCETFANFITGQCLEACILGMMFFIAMLLLGLPYALLTSMLIGLTALIPIFGAFIGCAVGALLIALVDPIQALIFLVLFLVLQQVEGNLIYPHVVGGSVGLPSIWVLVAITVGGSLFGVLGMLVFIPLCSVLYTLFAGYVKHRLREKNIEIPR